MISFTEVVRQISRSYFLYSRFGFWFPYYTCKKKKIELNAGKQNKLKNIIPKKKFFNL